MKSRALSTGRKTLRAFASMQPLRLTRDEEGFKNLGAVPERQCYSAEVIAVHANRASLRALGILRRGKFPGIFSIDSDVLPDAKSHAIVRWYDMLEMDRPSDMIGMQTFLFAAAATYIRKAALEHTRFVRSAFDYQRSNAIDWVKLSVPPHQETHLAAIQARNVIVQLPSQLRAMALKMADGATLPEAATELGMDLFDAMECQKKVRLVADRIVNDGALIGIFAKVYTGPKRPRPQPVLPQRKRYEPIEVFLEQETNKKDKKHRNISRFLALLADEKNQRRRERLRRDHT